MTVSIEVFKMLKKAGDTVELLIAQGDPQKEQLLLEVNKERGSIGFRFIQQHGGCARI